MYKQRQFVMNKTNKMWTTTTTFGDYPFNYLLTKTTKK